MSSQPARPTISSSATCAIRTSAARSIDRRFDEVYQLAADMGGRRLHLHAARTTPTSCTIRHRSILTCWSALHECSCAADLLFVLGLHLSGLQPGRSRTIPTAPRVSAYPAAPDSEYGWEKLFSERLYLAYTRNHGIEVRIARYHNIFGPEGTWPGGKEKAPAALCRKVAEATNGGAIEIWGDGKQTRSFLYIDECLEGYAAPDALADSSGPVNIGSDEMVTINQLADMITDIAGKQIGEAAYPRTAGRARPQLRQPPDRGDSAGPSQPLWAGLEATYEWIERQVMSNSGVLTRSAVPAV